MADDRAPDRDFTSGDVSIARRLGNWRTIASIVFALALLFFLFRVVLNVDFGEVWRLVIGANPVFLLLAFLAYYTTFPLRGLRWHFVLARTGTHVRYRDATEILFLSWFVNCLVPAKLGDLYRAYLLKGNYGASGSRTVGTVFIERVADVVVIFGLALAAGFWSFRGRSTPQIDALFLAGFVFALILVILVLSLRFWGRRLQRFMPERIGELWERFHEGSTGALTVRSLPVILVLTGMVWVLEGLRLYFVIRALALPEVGLGISASIFVALGGALLTAIPLTPAGIGFVQAGIVALMSFYGIGATSGAAVALTDWAISILTVIILGGIVYAFSDKVRRAHGPSAALAPASEPAERGPTG
ncbi:MAG: lysylphosphatidylglycerol synthase transmembrane domain-containing protein [Candidatus Limnocylindria bacterium]